MKDVGTYSFEIILQDSEYLVSHMRNVYKYEFSIAYTVNDKEFNKRAIKKQNEKPEIDKWWIR